MRTILVDDEPVILEEIKAMLEENRNIEIVGAYTEPLEAIHEISVTKPDWAFLDIEMAGMSGIELAEKLSAINPDMDVLFITAYNHYAAEAFEVNAIDYLLKPLRPERLNKAIDRLLKNRKNKPESPDISCKIRCFGSFEVIVGNNPIKWSRSKTKELLAYLLQHEGRRLEKYRLCDALWPEHDPDKVLAYLQTSVWTLRKSLKEAGCTQVKIEFAGDRYILRLSAVDWDLGEFERQYKMFIQSGSLEAAKKAIQCHSGDYLEGEDWLWADIPRERYTLKYNELSKEIRPVNGRKGT